uniref:Transposase n=1 Tax=Ditylenchus dipsaci TaxID=166011 RepID=A0A915CX54_9BILA
MTYWDTGGFEFTVYRIQDIKWKKRLGSGGVASVWIASLLSDKHSKMAVKKQSPSAKIMRAHPDITVRLYGKMFLTEIQCMQKLNGQSNICHLFNFGFENQTCYMAIELADSDLETMIIDKQKFDKYEVGFFKLLYNLTYICY